jgi:hypothetical protein
MCGAGNTMCHCWLAVGWQLCCPTGQEFTRKPLAAPEARHSQHNTGLADKLNIGQAHAAVLPQLLLLLLLHTYTDNT